VVSLERGALAASLDAGRGPEGLYRDETGGQLFVPAEGPAGGPEGELRVFRGDTLAATLKTAAKPKLFARERDAVYVVGEKAVTLVHPVVPQVTATLPLARGAEGLVDDDDQPTELKVSPDGTRAFVHYGLHHKVATLDLEARKAVGSTKTGSGGKKFLGNMMGGLYGWPGMLAAGYSIWIHTQPSMLAVRPDGRFAYAVNNQTKDVTVVDGATGKSVETIGGNGYSLELLKGGRFLYEVADSDLRLIDLERNTEALEIPLPDLRGLFFAPDRSVALALAKRAVLVLDGASGKPLARDADFVSADAIAFELPSRSDSAPTEPSVR
jgi:DNA-binding beta-propeller fold protein YncE